MENTHNTSEKYYCKGAVVKHQEKEKVATESMNDLVKVFFPLILKTWTWLKKAKGGTSLII